MRKGISLFYEMVASELFGDKRTLTHEEKQGLQLLNVAYEVAKMKHYDQMRDDGDRYFEHLREVAEILVSEFTEFVSVETAIISILHDSLEDTSLQYETIENLFGEIVATWVKALTKDKVVSWGTKEERNRDYFEHIVHLPLPLLAIKFSDRIHNLRTLLGCTKGKILRKIEETEEFFLSKEMIEKFPDGTEKIRREIDKLKWEI